MPNQQLLDYIKTQTLAGVSLDIIKTNLLASGMWMNGEIDAAIQTITSPTNANTASTPSQTPSPTVASLITQEKNIPPIPPQQGTPKWQGYLYTTIAVLVLVVLGGTAFAFVNKIGPFGERQYTEENFLSRIADKITQIKSSSYRASYSLVVTPREANAKPFEIEITNQADLEKLYANDYQRVQDISSILSQLNYQKSYPPSLEKFFQDLKKTNPYYYNNISLKDPVSGQPYEYSQTEGGNNFNLKVSLATKEAISAVKKSFYYNEEHTTIDGLNITFTKDSGPYVYIPQELPKPFLIQLAEYTKYLPSELSADVSFGGSADIEKSKWKFNIDANGNFGDLTYKVNIDALKNESDYFVKINNIPSLFLGSLSSAKGQWIKISNAGESTGNYDELSFVAESLPEMEASYKKNREEFSRIMNKAIQFAAEEKLIGFGKKPYSEKMDGRTLYRYDIKVRKNAIIPFYEKLLTELENGDYETLNPILNDRGLLAYFSSKEFEQVFDYYNQNVFLAVWVDSDGFPSQIEYKMRIVPPEDVTQLKDKQANLVFTFTLSDINKGVEIETPTETKDLKELIKDSPFGEAMNKGANASIKANLSSVRAYGELYYDEHNNYGKASTKGKCDTANTLFTDTNIKAIIEEINKILETNQVTDTPSCWSTGTAWALSVKLVPQEETDYWCVDSTGVSVLTDKHTSSVKCP